VSREMVLCLCLFHFCLPLPNTRFSPQRTESGRIISGNRAQARGSHPIVRHTASSQKISIIVTAHVLRTRGPVLLHHPQASSLSPPYRVGSLLDLDSPLPGSCTSRLLLPLRRFRRYSFRKFRG
jgi:hypothetical protein